MSSAAPQKCTKLASVVGASAATNSHAASRCQVCPAAALRRCISHAATQTCALWQAVRRDEIAGREHIGTDQFQWGAQLAAPHLCVLAIPPIEHVLTCGWLERPVCSAHRTFSSSTSRTATIFRVADTWALGCAQRCAGSDPRQPLRGARWPRALNAEHAYLGEKSTCTSAASV